MTVAAFSRSQPIPAARADDVRRSFARYGAAWVRGATDPAALADVARAAKAVLAERDELIRTGGILPEAARKPHERRFVPLRDLRLPFPDDALVPSVAHAVAGEYLGPGYVLGGARSFRTIEPGAGGYLDLHQDQTILGRKLVNVWIAVTACGVDAPGLEVVLGSWRTLLPPVGDQGSEFAAERARVDEREAVETFGAEAFVAPAFEPGDAMLFSGATIHRTYARPGMSRPRSSLELRLVAAADEGPPA